MASPDPPISRETPDRPIKEPSRSPPSLTNHEVIDGEASAPQLEQTERAPREDKGVSPRSKGPVICGICTTAASKYKCSRCYLPYCSVACNKTHQMNHPPDPEPQPQSTPRPSQPPAEPETADALHPFQILATSDKLSWLFRKYPKLPQQLLDIHTQTLPPAEDASVRIPASLRQGVPARGNWTHEKGISKGKAALRRARQLPGEAGEAVREYCLLVLLLLEENEAKNGARTVLQQEFAQQDAELIRQLMEMEKGRT
ncbi:hypothetical protein CP532_1672 [Ophiocordyceps camponoti-leonardi (nom. inval.)]|nr:hypothetical protein CP532_1672 [Ophiocordyceps camponoti-leonardi (nom. inval.)]